MRERGREREEGKGSKMFKFGKRIWMVKDIGFIEVVNSYDGNSRRKRKRLKI